MKEKIYDLQQADLALMQGIADAPDATTFEAIKRLLFSGDYRISGGLLVPTSPASGKCLLQAGDFVKANGSFYSILSDATINILSGTDDPTNNKFGNGVDASTPNIPVGQSRKDIVCINFLYVNDTPAVKKFIDTSTIPPTEYTQTVNTKTQRNYHIVVLHGTPSTTPAESAVPSGYMKLATVLVAHGDTTIVAGAITNNTANKLLRLDAYEQSTAPASAGSDVLHSNGIFSGYGGSMAITETAPQSMGVSVADGRMLFDGVLADFPTPATVANNPASFVDVVAEAISFSGGNTQQLAEDSTPPHKIRASGADVYAGATHFTVDYNNPGTALQININTTTGAITRIDTINVPVSVSVDYRYYLPRIDLVQANYGTQTLSMKQGVASHTPVAPLSDPSNLALAYIAVGEGVTVITNSNITDLRIYSFNLNEAVTARGSRASINARLSNSLNADGSLKEIEEKPSGAVGGGNKIFTMANSAQNNKVKVFRDGLRLFAVDGDYIVSGTTITLTVAPLTGAKLTIEYIPAS